MVCEKRPPSFLVRPSQNKSPKTSRPFLSKLTPEVLHKILGDEPGDHVRGSYSFLLTTGALSKSPDSERVMLP